VTAVVVRERLAVTASEDGSLRIWDIDTLECLRVLRDQPRTPASALCVSLDGRFAVTACADGGVRLWNLATGELVRIMKGHTDRVRFVSLSLDGQLIVSTGQDRVVRVWRLADGECLTRCPVGGRPTAMSPIDRRGRFAIGTSDNRVVIMSLKGIAS
jgi:WD40 repeat protein